jgi:mono/diheme cytochrome c family protein
MKLRYPLLLVLSSVMFLSACNFSLAADVTPPPGYKPPTAVEDPAEATTGPLYPLVPPDPARGEVIYLEKCAPCHGETGLGDGPQAADLPNPAPAIGTVEVARLSAPAAWFKLVTQGNIERFMPPFRSLSDGERWDVVAYAQSLSLSADQLALGEQLYQDNCAECHGAGGQGDGPGAVAYAEPLPDFSDLELMAARSNAALYQAISDGIPSRGMPAFADRLAEEERWALADYLRSFMLAPAGGVTENLPESTLTPAADLVASDLLTSTGELSNTETLSATQALGVISGVVTNPSGGDLPVGESITLHAFDMADLVFTMTAPLNDDGLYLFENLEMPVGRSFFTTLDFEGVTYGSQFASVEEAGAALEMPINVYPSTTDSSLAMVDRLHFFFEFIDEQTLQVSELYIIVNPGNETLVASEQGQPVLSFTVPAEATNLQFSNEDMMSGIIQPSEQGFDIITPIRPTGDEGLPILFSYDMPYNRKLELSRPVDLLTNAVVILVPAGNIKVKGDQIQDVGTRDVEGGMQFQMYTGGNLSAGQTLDLTITGKPSEGEAAASNTNSTTGILIGIAALGLVLVVAGVWLYRRNLKVQPEQVADEAQGAEPAFESPEAVMDAILALDDLYQEGKLPEDAYLPRRAELKEQLRNLTKGE